MIYVQVWSMSACCIWNQCVMNVYSQNTDDTMLYGGWKVTEYSIRKVKNKYRNAGTNLGIIGNSAILKYIYALRCEMETVSFVPLWICTSTYIVQIFFHSADDVFNTEDILVLVSSFLTIHKILLTSLLCLNTWLIIEFHSFMSISEVLFNISGWKIKERHMPWMCHIFKSHFKKAICSALRFRAFFILQRMYPLIRRIQNQPVYCTY